MRLKCIVGSFAHFLFFGIIVVSIVPSFLIYLILYILRRDLNSFFQRAFAFGNRIFFTIVPKIVVKIEPIYDLPQSAIYISTHQSILDYPILTMFVKKHTMLAKINFKAVPFVSFFSNLVGVKSLAAKRLDEVGLIYRELEEILYDNKNIILFPEGTRHDGAKLEPFKRGAFRLAFKTKKPMVPVVIEGLTKILPRKSFCFKTSKRTVVHVKVLEPLYPENFKNDIEMMKQAQRIMQQEKEKLCDI